MVKGIRKGNKCTYGQFDALVKGSSEPVCIERGWCEDAMCLCVLDVADCLSLDSAERGDGRGGGWAREGMGCFCWCVGGGDGGGFDWCRLQVEAGVLAERGRRGRGWGGSGGGVRRRDGEQTAVGPADGRSPERTTDGTRGRPPRHGK